jgi:thioredoxin reductase (NADPH)
MTPDLVIVGAGPAGVSAALWAQTLGLGAVILESGAEAGGQLHHVHFHPSELPGLGAGDGPTIAAAMTRQLSDAGFDVRYDTAAVALEPADGRGRPAVRDATGTRIEGQTMLVTCGVRRRRLGVPGERELEGRGVSYSATRDRARFAGKRVAVVGGGDGAFENALLLAGVECDVVLAVRGAPRARREFRERVGAERHIEVLEGVRVAAILGDDAVRAVRLEGADGAEDVAVTGVIVKIGAVPNTEWCLDALAHDDQGYLLVDEHGRTSRERVWAAGDVTRPVLPSISIAIGSAAQAVADIRRTLRGE